MTNYPVGDTLIRLKNAYLSGHDKTLVRYSSFIIRLLEVLKQQKYIKDYRQVEVEGKPAVEVRLRYTKSASKRQPAVNGLKIVSKPGRRVYVGYDKIPPVFSGLGINILSTSQGVLTGAEAKKKKVGGELICQVW